MSAVTPRWPELSYSAWRATCDTLHGHTQLLGKLAVGESAPPEPQLQHAALRLTARGWETAPLPAPDRSGAVVVALDLRNHEAIVEGSGGTEQRIALAGERSVGAVCRELLAALRRVVGDVKINATTQEASWSVPLDEDDEDDPTTPSRTRPSPPWPPAPGVGPVPRPGPRPQAERRSTAAASIPNPPANVPRATSPAPPAAAPSPRHGHAPDVSPRRPRRGAEDPAASVRRQRQTPADGFAMAAAVAVAPGSGARRFRFRCVEPRAADDPDDDVVLFAHWGFATAARCASGIGPQRQRRGAAAPRALSAIGYARAPANCSRMPG